MVLRVRVQAQGDRSCSVRGGGRVGGLCCVFIVHNVAGNSETVTRYHKNKSPSRFPRAQGNIIKDFQWILLFPLCNLKTPDTRFT